MPKQIAKHYSRLFGLPADKIRFFDDLTNEQVKEVDWGFSLMNADKYVYVLKTDGRLVSTRYKRNFLIEPHQHLGREVGRR